MDEMNPTFLEGVRELNAIFQQGTGDADGTDGRDSDGTDAGDTDGTDSGGESDGTDSGDTDGTDGEGDGTDNA